MIVSADLAGAEGSIRMKNRDWIIEATFERDVHDHEVLIAFESDARGVAFRDWFAVRGHKLFDKWWKAEDQEYYK